MKPNELCCFMNKCLSTFDKSELMIYFLITDSGGLSGIYFLTTNSVTP